LPLAFLESALVPLMLGISLDLFLLGRLIFDNVAFCIAIAVAMFLIFFGL
jgi:hypothetical protein